MAELIKAVKDNRYAHRDATMIMTTFRHGLRASELADLRWDQIDFASAALHVRRVKRGSPSTHPILGRRAACPSSATARAGATSPFVFMSQRNAPFTTAGFARMLERAGIEAKLGFKATLTC